MYIAYMMKIKKLEEKRNALLKELCQLGPMIKGSVGISRWHCKNKKCRCHTKGELHKAVILTWKEKQKSVSRHVPKALHDEVYQWVSSMGKARQILKEIGNIQREIFYLKREEAKEKKE